MTGNFQGRVSDASGLELDKGCAEMRGPWQSDGWSHMVLGKQSHTLARREEDGRGASCLLFAVRAGRREGIGQSHDGDVMKRLTWASAERFKLSTLHVGAQSRVM